MYSKSIFFYTILFFFIFNTNLIFLPFPTIAMIACIGLIVFVFVCFCEKKTFKINVKVVGSFLILIIFSLLTSLTNDYVDIFFLKNEVLIAVVAPFFGAFLVAYLGRNIIFSLRDLIRVFVVMNTIQAVIVWIAFFSSPFKVWLLNIQKWGDRTGFIAEYSGRLFGIGMRFDYGSVYFSISLLSIIYLYFTKEKAKPLKYFCIYIFQMAAGLMIARSIVIGILCSILFFVWISSKKSYKYRIFLCIIACVISIILGLNIFADKVEVLFEEHQNTFMWMFEFFFKEQWIARGKTTNSWSTIINDMYYIPDSTKILLIGTGHFESLKCTGYHNTDPLYMKYLMYFGFFGVVSFLTFFLNNIIALISKANAYDFSTKREKELFRKYIIVITLFTLLMYAKSNCHCFSYIFYIYFSLHFIKKEKISDC